MKYLCSPQRLARYANLYRGEEVAEALLAGKFGPIRGSAGISGRKPLTKKYVGPGVISSLDGSSLAQIHWAKGEKFDASKGVAGFMVEGVLISGPEAKHCPYLTMVRHRDGTAEAANFVYIGGTPKPTKAGLIFPATLEELRANDDRAAKLLEANLIKHGLL